MNESVISAYPLAQAIADGVLVEVLRPRWTALSGGKPIVASAAVAAALSPAAIAEIWNAYVAWQRSVRPALAEEEQLFVTTMNGEPVWVIEDGQAHTVLYPDDY